MRGIADAQVGCTFKMEGGDVVTLAGVLSNPDDGV